MTREHPQHLEHRFDEKLFLLTNMKYTCYRCFEEDQEQKRRDEKIRVLLRKKDADGLTRFLLSA